MTPCSAWSSPRRLRHPPDLSEGRLASSARRSSTRARWPCRPRDRAGTHQLGRGEERPAAAEGLDPQRHRRGRHRGRAPQRRLRRSGPLVHRLFDPLIAAASELGAGLDWKTSLQELSAEHGLGVPEYIIDDEGPDHMKTFTAQVRVGEQLYGNGVGRSKKEAEQAAAETAYGELAESLGVSDPLADGVAESAGD